jgi:hypothetical protein
MYDSYDRYDIARMIGTQFNGRFDQGDDNFERVIMIIKPDKINETARFTFYERELLITTKEFEGKFTFKDIFGFEISDTHVIIKVSFALMAIKIA